MMQWNTFKIDDFVHEENFQCRKPTKQGDYSLRLEHTVRVLCFSELAVFIRTSGVARC